MLTMSYVAAAISGGLWGAIAWWIGQGLNVSASALWVGIIASPGIGLLVAWLIRPLRDIDFQGGIIVSAMVLYGTSALFGLVLGSATVSGHDRPNRSGLIGILSMAATVPIGLALSGLVVVLAPLAVGNCFLIWTLQRNADVPGPTTSYLHPGTNPAGARYGTCT